MNRIIMNLKTEAMKPRHWKDLLKKLKITIPERDITMQNLWD